MDGRASSRARGLIVALLTVALVAAGCGGGSDDAATTTGSTGSSQTRTSTGSTETSTGNTTGTQTQTGTKTEKKKEKKSVIAWILGLGPGAPDGPSAFTVYRELQRLRCDRVFDRVVELEEPARTLYTGAAQACLAAFEGRGGLWPQATTAYDEDAARAGELTCMDRAAFALLERLLTLHAQHPNRSFAKAGKSQSKAPPCPRIVALQPDHGDEGVVVRMTGRNLVGNVVGVSVIDSFGSSLPAEDVTDVGGALEFTMPEAPPSDASASVCIVVRADPDWSADGVMFTYESEFVGAPTPFACPPPEDA